MTWYSYYQESKLAAFLVVLQCMGAPKKIKRIYYMGAKIYIEDITRWREYMDLIFEWWKQYFTNEQSEWVKHSFYIYIIRHSFATLTREIFFRKYKCISIEKMKKALTSSNLLDLKLWNRFTWWQKADVTYEKIYPCIFSQLYLKIIGGNVKFLQLMKSVKKYPVKVAWSRNWQFGILRFCVFKFLFGSHLRL